VDNIVTTFLSSTTTEPGCEILQMTQQLKNVQRGLRMADFSLVIVFEMEIGTFFSMNDATGDVVKVTQSDGVY